MAKYILALDQGTTSSRAILFNRQGASVATAQQEFEQILPRPGVVEHDANAIWKTQLAVAQQVMRDASADPADIAAIGVTNQRETTVLWDRGTGEPIHNAIVWQSRVTAGMCQQLKAAGHEALFKRKTGLVVDAYFSGTKIKHLLDKVAGARERAACGEVLFGTIDSFLIWKLTGGRCHVTDPSNASRTLIYNIHEGDWDQQLLDILDIPREMLPQVRDSSEVYGECEQELFGRAIPVASAIGDQQAATFGQACFEVGSVKNTYGTGCFMLMNTGAEPIVSENQLLTTIGWRIDGKVTYCLEGSVFIAGAVVQWLRDGLGLISSSSEIEALAAGVEDNGGVYLVPAFVGLGAPHWDQFARGAIFGLTRGTTAGHLARAAIESMAFQSRDLLIAMEKDSHLGLAELKVDGGAAANDALLQFQADLLEATVRRPKVFETTALGAAYLAGLAVGFWKDQDEVARCWALDREFKSEMNSPRREALCADWARAVERSLGWASSDE